MEKFYSIIIVDKVVLGAGVYTSIVKVDEDEDGNIELHRKLKVRRSYNDKIRK